MPLPLYLNDQDSNFRDASALDITSRERRFVWIRFINESSCFTNLMLIENHSAAFASQDDKHVEIT